MAISPGRPVTPGPAAGRVCPIEAVVFDMDGVLVDTERRWSDVREALTRRTGGSWHEGAHEAMMGMSSPQWSTYMHEELGVPMAPEQILAAVTDELAAGYRRELPLLEGAVAAVHTAAAVGRLAVASSSPRSLLALVLELAGVRERFDVLVSSEEVAAGKPAPDVYLEACARLGVEPARAVAVEDSGNGILAARAAGLRVVAVPNADYPPGETELAAADAVVPRVAALTVAALRG